PGFPDHVVDHLGVLVLRAEHDDAGVLIDPHIMTGGPVEEVVGCHCLLLARGIRGGDPAIQDEAPMRTLTQIALEALEQGRRIDTLGEAEILPADLAITAYVAEVSVLADHRSWNAHSDVDVVLRNSHGAS